MKSYPLSRWLPWTGLLMLGMTGCHEEAHRADTPPLPTLAVTATQAREEIRASYEQVMGTVRAKTFSTLEARLNGRVTELPVEAGQAVTAGQLLVRIEAGEVVSRVEQAEAALRQAELDHRRLENLWKAQAATRAEYDAAITGLKVAQATLEEARALLADTRLEAPFAGRVARTMTEVGDQAAPGKPLLALEQDGPFQALANIPEGLLSHLQLGMTCQVAVASLQESLPGRVAEINAAGDPVSRTWLVKFDLPAHPDLRTGKFARLAVPAGQEKVLLIPKSALLRRGQLEQVFVITNQTARLRLIQTGPMEDGMIQVLSGLLPGENVLSSNPAAVRDGQPVQLP